MKSTKRAERRAKFSTIKRKVASYAVNQWLTERPEKERLRAINRQAHTRALCSCAMCCNPRRRFGERNLTVQELRWPSLDEELQNCKE